MLQIVLLAGKFVFLIVLYLFIWRVIHAVNRDMRVSFPVPGRGRYAAGEVRGADLGQAADNAAYATGVPYAGAVRAGGAPYTTGAYPPGAASAAGQTWALVVVKSPQLRVGEAFAFPPGASAMAGRSPDMDIYLDDTFVSSRHALFEAGAGALRVEDLNSTNGTQVNGESISEPRQLRAGDRVEVGDTVFQVEAR